MINVLILIHLPPLLPLLLKLVLLNAPIRNKLIQLLLTCLYPSRWNDVYFLPVGRTIRLHLREIVLNRDVPCLICWLLLSLRSGIRRDLSDCWGVLWYYSRDIVIIVI